jgi:chemotaxis protein MotA
MSFLNVEPESDELVQNLLRYAFKARKEGLLSLDSELARIQEPFLKESLMLAIDGVNASDLRKMMELQLDYQGENEERAQRCSKPPAVLRPPSASSAPSWV